MSQFIGTNESDRIQNNWEYDYIALKGGDDVVSGYTDFDVFVTYDITESTIFGPGHKGAMYFAPQNDTILMGAGNDTLFVGGGYDNLSGGEGFDALALQTYVYDESQVGYLGRTGEIIGERVIVVDLARGTIKANGVTLAWTVTQHPLGSTDWSSGYKHVFSHDNMGAMSHSIIGFEAVLGGSDQDEIMRGSSAPLEMFSVGGTGTGLGGSDQINGRGGFDIVSFASVRGNVLADLTQDTAIAKTLNGNIQTTHVIENIEGIIGSEWDDTLIGDRQDNVFGGSDGVDSIKGGLGRDTLAYDMTYLAPVSRDLFRTVDGVFVNLNKKKGGSEDVLGQILGIEDVIGSAGDDTIKGDTGENRLDGRAGDDSLFGSASNDTLTGGEGEDTLEGGSGWDLVDYSYEEGELGVNVTMKSLTALDTYGDTDTYLGIEAVRGTEFRDLIKGDNRPNEIWGGDGRDNLGGLGGKDTIHGGQGKDAIGGGDGADVLDGGAASDTILGGAGHDQIFGGDGNDQLFGGANADDVYGDDGADQIKDDKDGTADNLLAFTRNMKELAHRGEDVLAAVAALESSNHLYGGDGQDTLLGIGLLDGGKGKDELRGDGVLFGGDGNDYLVTDTEFSSSNIERGILMGGLGNDTLEASAISPSAVYNYSARAVSVDLELGIAKAGMLDQDVLIGIQQVIGSNFDDTLKSSLTQENSLGGSLGDDKIILRHSASAQHVTHGAYGGGGNDTFVTQGANMKAVLDGAEGNDRFYLRGGNFDVYGGLDNDLFQVEDGSGDIEGNSGADQFFFQDASLYVSVNGGVGADRFIFKTGSGGAAWITGGPGRDTTKILPGVEASLKVLFEDFDPETDVIQVSRDLATSFDTAAELAANVQTEDDGKSPPNSWVTLDNGATLFFEGVAGSDMDMSWFQFF